MTWISTFYKEYCADVKNFKDLVTKKRNFKKLRKLDLDLDLESESLEDSRLTKLRKN